MAAATPPRRLGHVLRSRGRGRGQWLAAAGGNDVLAPLQELREIIRILRPQWRKTSPTPIFRHLFREVTYYRWFYNLQQQVAYVRRRRLVHDIPTDRAGKLVEGSAAVPRVDYQVDTLGCNLDISTNGTRRLNYCHLRPLSVGVIHQPRLVSGYIRPKRSKINDLFAVFSSSAQARTCERSVTRSPRPKGQAHRVTSIYCLISYLR